MIGEGGDADIVVAAVELCVHELNCEEGAEISKLSYYSSVSGTPCKTTGAGDGRRWWDIVVVTLELGILKLEWLGVTISKLSYYSLVSGMLSKMTGGGS